MNQVSGAGTNDMRPKDPVSICIRQKFDKPICCEIRFGASIAHEHEFSNLVRAALLYKRVLGKAHVCDFRVRINHTRNDAIIHMSMLTGDNVCGGHAFVFGLMCQHWAVDRIPNCIDAIHICAPFVISFDLSPI